MELKINLEIKEFFKTDSVALYFSLTNEKELNFSPKASKEVCKCFNTSWSELTPGIEHGKNINELYKPIAEKLAKFFKIISLETKVSTHYFLTSNNNEEIYGLCVASIYYNSEFTRNLTSDELRKLDQEIKNALEGL